MISCKNLTIGHDNRSVQKNINFSIEKGTYVCVLGDNGTGKSTLIKTMLGLIPPHIIKCFLLKIQAFFSLIYLSEQAGAMSISMYQVLK